MPFALSAADGTPVLLITRQCVSEDPDPRPRGAVQLAAPSRGCGGLTALSVPVPPLQGAQEARGRGQPGLPQLALGVVPDRIFLTSSQRWRLLLTAVILRSRT